MPGQTHKNHKKGVSTCRKFWCLSACRKFWCLSVWKKSTSPLTTLLRYCKDIACCYFEYFRHAWLYPSNMIVPTFLILWCLFVQKSTSSFKYFGCEWQYSTILIASTCRKVYLHVKNQLHASLLSWDIAEILQTCYFGYFGHAWPSPSRRWYLLQGNFDAYLHAKKKISVTSFLQNFGYFKHAWPPTPKEQFLLVGNFDVYLNFILEILHFKESSIWLAKSILIQNLRKILLSDKGFAVKYTWLCFILDYFQEN